jgi:hypothetical protein
VIHLVVPCTRRKRAEPGPRLRDVAVTPEATRARLWIERLESCTVQPRPAGALYAGDHWCVVRELAGRLMGWVMSGISSRPVGGRVDRAGVAASGPGLPLY